MFTNAQRRLAGHKNALIWIGLEAVTVGVAMTAAVLAIDIVSFPVAVVTACCFGAYILWNLWHTWDDENVASGWDVVRKYMILIRFLKWFVASVVIGKAAEALNLRDVCWYSIIIPALHCLVQVLKCSLFKGGR
ncbi:hypothetical protein DPEC_G00170120 [Dallia pectoralis]|uniref:Uncharacterized protein n=1 Tax=Dallia pectoralis TaxID=75939 RepID=A0ACC2GCQ2_DALPE|nr:hypothetical protein DPEC_G00170120 [Dallia pectoralis]